jgi:hypothetical protein
VEAAEGCIRKDGKAVFFENGLCRQQAEKYQRASSTRILASARGDEQPVREPSFRVAG